MKPLAQNSMIQNRYLVVQMIGKGGMGEVYLAVDQRLGSAVALKRTFFNENEGLASAFEREARILGRLRHPVLPKVIDHFGEGTDQYLVMEHISGDDLGKRLETAGKPFPLNWVMFWADQLLDALNYLHSHEPPIIHRDIKPENLKLTDENHIILLDFGLSKDFDSNADTASLGTGSVVGYSPHFASMEQVRGTGTDARSDIYSFSATIYQLLTNTIPGDSLARADALLGGKADLVQPISGINKDVSPAISDAVLKGLSVRQDERYGSAAEMQKALRRAFNNLPGEAPAKVTSEAQTRMMSVPAGIIEGTTNAPPTTNEYQPQADVRTQVMDRPAPESSAEFDPEQVTQTRIDHSFGAGAASVGAALPSDPPEQQAPHVPSRPHASKKKGKGGLVIGGLLGLLLLAGLAAAGGWYGYTRYYLPAQAQSSPTPTPDIPVASPTLEPTSTPLVAEANTNTQPSANTDVPEANVNAEAPRPSRTGAPPTDTRPNAPPLVRATPKTPQTTGAKPTPKPNAPSDRTVILQ